MAKTKPIDSKRLGYKQSTDLNQLGKLPPQATDLEEAVLGAVMLEQSALVEIMDFLRPEHFYKDAHKEIFEAITSLFSESEPIDILTVTAKLRKTGKLEFVGGAYYITQLTNRVSSSANMEFHSRIIAEQAMKRECIAVGSMLTKDGYEDTTDAFELLDRAEQALYEVAHKTTKRTYTKMSHAMVDAFDQLEKRKNKSLTGVPSGFTSLDRITGGWQNSDLVIIAARPGMGKTAFAVTCIRNAAVDHEKPVAIFSLEMSTLQLVNRLISGEASIDSEKLKNGNLNSDEWGQLTDKTARLTKAPIFIDDTPALSIIELRAKCRRLKIKHDIQLIVVDYLQLMVGEYTNKNGNREQEIASISRNLKNLAKDLNVPVIALSQLSRAVETRGGDKRPQLSDLRESGSIEQDADMVMFLYRPEYYGLTQDENGMPTQGVGEVIISKHRNGSLDTVQLKFIGKYTRFSDMDLSPQQAGGYGGSAWPTEGSNFDNNGPTQ